MISRPFLARAGTVAGIVLLRAAAGCTEANPSFHGDGGGGGDGPSPFVEAGRDRGPGGEGHPADVWPWLPDGFSCSPGQFLSCKTTNVLTRCNSSGAGIVHISCAPYLCNATYRRCNECDPSAVAYCLGNDLISCSSSGLKQTKTCPDGCWLGQCQSCVKSPYYKDGDGDGQGDPNVIQQACSAPSGYVENSDDCDDQDALAYEGQAKYFTYKTKGTDDYDFDCDGTEEQESSSTVGCYKSGSYCYGSGWVSTIPSCGGWALYATCVKGTTGCYASPNLKQQGCH